jgi:ribonuclease BN (tRNA processing enzyme)
MTVQITFLGSGDAFGSGGRFQTCFLVESSAEPFLIDCGASSLIAMRRFRVAPNDVRLILLSHLHGDHFGGIPFFLLDAQLVSKRSRPLTIAGPAGTRSRLEQAAEALFPGSWQAERPFPLEIVELETERAERLEGLTVTPYPVDHPSGGPSLGLRIEIDGKVVAYSGDTEWTESLLPLARDADLLIAEAYYFEKQVRFHLDLRTLSTHVGELRARRVVLTHMSQDMLSRLGELEWEHAEDGKVIRL